MLLQRSNFGHLSFEFFPPKTARETHNLLRTARRLAEFEPDFYSVTHGAGGSSRDGTLETVRLLRTRGFNAIPHLTWQNDSREEMVALLDTYASMGVKQLVVLRGDRSADSVVATGLLRYARELVALIREETDDQFDLNVACYPEVHPEAKSLQDDIRFLKEKVDAGADSCITQYFYNPDAYRSFVASCRAVGIEKPIVPGIMPIANFQKLVQFSEKCGAEIPRWLLMHLRTLAAEPERLKAFGAEVVADLCRRLFAFNAGGMHIYTLNLSRPTQALLSNLLEA